MMKRNIEEKVGFFNLKNRYVIKVLKVWLRLCMKFFLMNFLRTKPQVKILNILFYNLFCAVIRSRDEKEEDEGYDNTYDTFRIHFVGIKNYDAILR